MKDTFLVKLESEISLVKDTIKRKEQLFRLEEIARVYNGEDKVVSSHEIAEDMKKRGEEKKYLSGWGNLDAILGGFRRQHVVVITAQTKSGKTSFCIDLTSRLKEYNPLWFPFEESAEELITKFVERKEDIPLFYTPQMLKGDTIEWIEKKIIEAKAKYGSEIVFIDHLDFIVPFVGDRHDLKVGETMRKLKGLAKKLDVLIFLITHLKKAQVDKHPTLEDIRGSASIGQEADTVIMMWRQTERKRGEVIITDNVNISVQANRRTGRTGNVKMCYQNGRFVEFEWAMDTNEEFKKW